MPFSRGSSCPEIEPGSPALQADSLPFEVPWKTPVFLVAIKYNQDCPWKSLRKSPIRMVFPPALDSSTVSIWFSPEFSSVLVFGGPCCMETIRLLTGLVGCSLQEREEGMMTAWTFTRLRVYCIVQNRDKVSPSSALCVGGHFNQQSHMAL